MKSPIFALIDCNNFFCSCERVFNPKLAKVPVVVLSNNDGCIIARSEEAKGLGIPMGAPYYKYKHILAQSNGHVFSANFQLYADMSHRVMQILQTFSCEFEQYSIDEAFIKFDGYDDVAIIALATQIKEVVLRWTGLPISIGLGPTKTLAKIANHMAKKCKDIDIFNICDPEVREKVLSNFNIADVWGVGRKWSIKLLSYGILTAAQLANADIYWIRRNFTVIGERLVRELNGLSCIDLDNISPKKSIAATRSFGQLITDKKVLLEAISTYAGRAARKLRKQSCKVGVISVYIRTNRFHAREQQYYGSYLYKLPFPTSDTAKIIKAATLCLDKIYRSGYKYNKAGVVFLDLKHEDRLQRSLFIEEEDTPQKEQVMKTIDKLNRRYGADTVAFAAQGAKNPYWLVRCNSRSPRYTTNWKELLTVATT